MASIMACPKCAAEVLLPPRVSERWRCPYCHAEFALQEIFLTPQRRDQPVESPAPRPEIQPVFVSKVVQPAATMSRGESTAQRDRGTGFFGNLVGIVGGGFLGLAAGYYLLNYFGGPQFNFLEIPLPAVAHTQPGWTDPNAPAELKPVTPVESAPLPLPAIAVNEPQPDVVQATAIMESSNPAEVRQAIAEVPLPSANPPTPASYTSDELGEALALANAAIGCEECNSTGYVKRVVITGVREIDGRRIEQKAERQFPCEACGGHPESRVTQQVYRRLCRLAEVATFVEIDPDEPGIYERKQAVELVLMKAAGSQENLNNIGRLAGYWLANGERDQNGVLLAGTVKQVEQRGDHFLTRIVLFGKPDEAVVVSEIRGPLRQQDRVVIAGSIVENPSINLTGYQGAEPQVIWGGLPIKLPNEMP